MSKEEILAALRNLQNHATTNTSEQQAEVDRETAEIDATIEDYSEKIAELEAKIADMNNYQYEEYNREERELTEELLEESFANQIEVLDREDAEYKHLQDLATSIFTDYNDEIAQLNVEIAAIERRLRKNEIAVRKNIGIRLTDEELADLTSTLEAKKARVIDCENYKKQYTEELSNYGELITANNRKREIVRSKQERLAAIKAERANNPKTVDNFKLQRDKDELASLKAGLVALQTRREYINFDMKSEIDKLIQETQNLEFNIGNQEIPFAGDQNGVEDDNEFANVGFQVNPNAPNESENEPEKTDGKPEKTDDTPLGIPEETTGHDWWLAHNGDLDTEREAEIEEAKEELKKKKKEGFWRKHWRKFVAAGLALIAVLGMKSCFDLKNATPEDIEKAAKSYSQTDDGITEENQNDFDSKYEVPGEVDKKDDVVAPKSQAKSTPLSTAPSTNDTSSNNDKTEDKKQEVADKQEDNGKNQDTQQAVNNDDAKKEERESVELSAGDRMISTDDLFNINEETVITHGDEVGKSTNSAEVVDYTEEGKAVVEFDSATEDEKKVATEDTNTNKTKDEYIKALEEFAGGSIELTDEVNQWLDERVEGRSR